MEMNNRIGELSGRLMRAVVVYGERVELRWVETVGGIEDAGTGATVGGEDVVKSLEVNALVHEVAATPQLRRYTDIVAGDLMVDFLP